MSPILGALFLGAALGEEPPPPAEAEPAPTEPAPADPAPAEPAPASDRDEDAIFGGGAAERDEDAMFGGSDAPSVEVAPTAVDPAAPDSVLSGPSAPTDAGIFARLAEVDDRLAIGGQLYSRVDFGLAEGQDAGTASLAFPTLLDLYADVRPNDRLRAYVRGRVKNDFTVADGAADTSGNVLSATSVLLDQAWFKFDVARRVYLTVGQQRVKWGAGRFWNPTDFLNQQVRDPLAVFDERTGVGLVRAHIPFEAAGLNVYAVANFQEVTPPLCDFPPPADCPADGRVAADGFHPDEIGGALRVEWLVGNTEITASGAARKGQPLRLGGDVSTGVWFFDLRVEGAVQHGVTTPTWEGELDFDTFTLPTAVSREDDWIPQVVAAIEVPVRYNDEDSVTIGVEGFYNDAGYADASLYPWLIAREQFQPLYLGRAYVGGYVFLPAPGRWNDHTFTASVLSNLSDATGVARLDWRATVLTRLSVNAYVSGYFGEPGGEFRFALEVPAVPGVAGLENGISVPPPILGAGLGLSLVF